MDAVEGLPHEALWRVGFHPDLMAMIEWRARFHPGPRTAAAVVASEDALQDGRFICARSGSSLPGSGDRTLATAHSETLHRSPPAAAA